MARERDNREKEVKEFEEKVLEISRVTRVVKGGKRMNFRALAIVGDRKGRVGYGLGKAADVSEAIAKAVRNGKARLISAYMHKGTLPYVVRRSFKGATVLLKPAKPGTGIIAGGTARAVVELAGLQDIVAKSLGSSNKIAMAMATIAALASVKNPADILSGRDRTTK